MLSGDSSCPYTYLVLYKELSQGLKSLAFYR